MPPCTGTSSSSFSEDNDVKLSSDLDLSSDLEGVETAVTTAVPREKVGHHKLAFKKLQF